MSVHFSSQSNEWATPQDFFDAMHDEFNFTLDAAASADNAKCDRFYSIEDDGLSKSWKGERVWCNPPYGRGIGDWIEKAAISNADLVVMLIPARTDTKAWHRWIFDNPNATVRFIKGRLKFTGGGQESEQLERTVSVCRDRVSANAPFPSAVIIFRSK